MVHKWRVLALVSVAVFMVSLDLFVVNVAFPDIVGAFPGTSLPTVSWVLNAYAIVIAATMVSAGRLADQSGRRLVFMVGLVVFAIGSTLCGAAGSIGVLVGARMVQALGAAALLPTSLALLLPEFQPAERSAAIGIWAAVGGIAAACGPPLGGLLVEVSWRLVFFVNVPVAMIALLFAGRLLSESREVDGERPDPIGVVLLTGSVGLLAFGLVQAPAWGWSDVRTIAALVVAVVGGGAFAARCATHAQPLVEPALVRVRSFSVADISALLFSASFAAMLLGNVLFMTDVWGYSTFAAGLGLAPGPLAAAVLAARSGKLVVPLGSRFLGTLGTGLFALGCAWWLWRMGPSPDYLGEMLPGLLITGVGVGLTLPAHGSAAAGSLPPQRFATGSAIFTMSRQLGFVIGVAILVSILGSPGGIDPTAGFEGGWLFMVIAAARAAVAAAALDPPSVATTASPTPTPTVVRESYPVPAEGRLR